jgi:hypothetical protein
MQVGATKMNASFAEVPLGISRTTDDTRPHAVVEYRRHPGHATDTRSSPIELMEDTAVAPVNAGGARKKKTASKKKVPLVASAPVPVPVPASVLSAVSVSAAGGGVARMIVPGGMSQASCLAFDELLVGFLIKDELGTQGACLARMFLFYTCEPIERQAAK